LECVRLDEAFAIRCGLHSTREKDGSTTIFTRDVYMKEDPNRNCGDRTCALCIRGPSTRPTPTSHKPNRSSSFEPTSTGASASGSTDTMPFATMPGGRGFFI
jgi:hypothetical protein